MVLPRILILRKTFKTVTNILLLKMFLDKLISLERWKNKTHFLVTRVFSIF